MRGRVAARAPTSPTPAIRLVCALVLALGGLPGIVTAAMAQEAPGPAERPGFIDVAWPGAAMGVGGFLAGAVVGGNLADCDGGDGFCELYGAFYGAAALGTIGLATGVHLGNDRRGSYPFDLLVAAGIWGVSMSLIAATGYDDGATAVGFAALPIVQLLGTVATERSFGDRRVRETEAREGGAGDALELGVGPAPGGGFGLAGRLRF